MEIEHTDFIKVSLAQTGIQLEFNWHRTVAFVFTLLTFYTSTYQRQEIIVCQDDRANLPSWTRASGK